MVFLVVDFFVNLLIVCGVVFVFMLYFIMS